MDKPCCRTPSMKLSPVLCVVIIVVWQWSSIASAAGQSADKPRLTRSPTTALVVPVVATCEKHSCGEVEDKDIQGWEAIKALHRQLDDDANGNVDLSESDEFLRDELKYEDNFDRHNTFHGDDNFISVEDLWSAWKNSEVYNWTVEETLHWLVHYVELPQYAETFQNNAVDGPMLPRLAVNNQFLATILGIKDLVHKQKIIVKAMDVVLFGPPKPSHNYVKDTALVLSLVIAVGGCWFAYIQHKYSKYHMKQMMKDMETLQRAEESLSELQEKLQQAHQQKKSVLEEKESLEEKMRDEIRAAKAEAERLHLARGNTDTELNRLRLAEEELVQVRRALRKAEGELEYRSAWFVPPLLQQWLQVTHEIELAYYNVKKQAAEKQLVAAKEGCEKLRKKRTTFMGSFRIAHGNSMDEVDHRIISAKAALNEVTSDLQERLHRWAQIEQILGLPIVNNPGLAFLRQSLHSDNISPSTLPSSPSSPLIAANLTPMELNPHLSLEDCDEDLPPTYSMVTDTSNQPSTLGSMKRTQALRAVQSASCLSNMHKASTSSASGYLERLHTDQKPSTSTHQMNSSKVLVGDSSTDVSTTIPQQMQSSGVTAKDNRIFAIQEQIPKSHSAAIGQKTRVSPTKEQMKMSQSSGALIAVQDLKKVQDSMLRLTQSMSVPAGSAVNKMTRPNTLPISQSERNLSSITSTNSENNNCSTLPHTTKKKSGWFKKHSSPTAAVLDENHEAGDSSDSWDSEDKKKKRKKLSFGKGKDKNKPSWYLQQ